MKKRIVTMVLMLLWTAFTTLTAQYAKGDSTYKKCFVGSTFAMLGNFAKNNKPDFAQLNLGYRLTGRDVISLEFKTWKYAWPLGIPTTSKSFEAEGTGFPGYIRENGVAIAYQHYWWKGLYSAVHVMNAWQTFVNTEEVEIDKGFQIFNTYRVGYHIKLFKDNFFFEPSIAITHRPYHTVMPESFKNFDDQWSKFLFGEPGLHFGFNF